MAVTVVICGSRTWRDEASIRAVIAQLPPGTRVVTGGARGADEMAARVAGELGYLRVTVVPADWARHGRAAGPIRNRRMLDEYKPALVIAFRAKGHSPGTDHMIRLAQQRGVPVRVIPEG